MKQVVSEKLAGVRHAADIGSEIVQLYSPSASQLKSRRWPRDGRAEEYSHVTASPPCAQLHPCAQLRQVTQVYQHRLLLTVRVRHAQFQKASLHL